MNRKKKGKGFVLWFTGLPKSGKSTIADNIFRILKKKGIKVERLDGDLIRKNINSDLSFSKRDREKNIERVSFIAKLLSRNDVAVIASFVSPYEAMREKVRMNVVNFIEVFVNTPLNICGKRDRQGLYKKAKEGQLRNFTGISDIYEKPQNPEIELLTDINSIQQSINKVIAYLKGKSLI